jgi:hypothetical protein
LRNPDRRTSLPTCSDRPGGCDVRDMLAESTARLRASVTSTYAPNRVLAVSVCRTGAVKKTRDNIWYSQDVISEPHGNAGKMQGPTIENNDAPICQSLAGSAEEKSV